MKSILVVDDELKARMLLKEILEEENYNILLAENGKSAVDIVSLNNIDLILLDLRLPDIDGITVLTEIQKIKPTIPVIIISAFGTIKVAVEAVKLGAYDFMQKPLEINRVLLTIRNALEKGELEQELAQLRENILNKYLMIGTSEPMQKVYSLIDKSAPSNASVLITGESGVGKEVVARAIHLRSLRKNKPFIKINCAAVPSELIESELFGYVKGAFSGAHSAKSGRFELADGGTLFLDEIGDMSLMTQAKILRFLQEGEIQRIGETKTVKVDVRLIAATNRNLSEEIAKKNFRDDLYHRLNVINMRIFPLRERREDIPPLVEYFITEFCDEYGVPCKELSKMAMIFLSNQKWIGNVRELKNVVERIVVLIKSQTVSAEDIVNILKEEESMNIKPNLTLKEARQVFEKEHILKTLTENNWSIGKTAKALNIERTNLYRKMKNLNIKQPNP